MSTYHIETFTNRGARKPHGWRIVEDNGEVILATSSRMMHVRKIARDEVVRNFSKATGLKVRNG